MANDPLITLIKSEWHETVPIEQNQIKLSVESVLLASYQSLYRHYEVKTFTVISGKGAEYGIGLAVPVSLLMLQLDVVARFCNVFLLHSVDKAPLLFQRLQ
jgi:hypothetical protein